MLLVAGTAWAQGGPPRQRVYTPAPKFSPYLYLSRGSVGGVPAYYAWVRPRVEYDQRVRSVDNELKMLEIQEPKTGSPTQSPGDQPSTAARFMFYQHQHQQYLHFYPPAKAPQR
jgi:hypothetical protein